MPQRGKLTDNYRELLESGDIFTTVLKTAAGLEHVFFCKLLFEKEVPPKLLKGWTLGRYITWVCDLGLIDSKYRPILVDFSILRNRLVHDEHFIYKIKPGSKRSIEVKNLILLVLDFIDNTLVTYKSTPELEKLYGNYILNDNIDYLEKYFEKQSLAFTDN